MEYENLLIVGGTPYFQHTSKEYKKTETLSGKISINTKDITSMEEKTIRIIPFTGEKEKWRMWSGNSWQEK